MPIKAVQETQSVKSGAGFTLMEIMVATVIFALVAVSLLSLFNFVLKINRRGEALRQAAQDSQNFVEYLVKEIRNGQVDYFVSNGNYNTLINYDANVPCRGYNPGNAVGVNDPPTYQTVTQGSASGLAVSNWLGIINTDKIEECFYFAKADGVTYVDSAAAPPVTFTASSAANYTLALEKSGITAIQKLNPPNSRIEDLMFVVRPQNDPYTKWGASGVYPKIQPVVDIIIKFVVQLPTGEQVPMYYQTAVSENKYDIPNQ
jgi:prepilin-type N-terminal cleavage/methylation domain-containing protein